MKSDKIGLSLLSLCTCSFGVTVVPIASCLEEIHVKPLWDGHPAGRAKVSVLQEVFHIYHIVGYKTSEVPFYAN